MGPNELAPRLRHRIDIEALESTIDSETNQQGAPEWTTVRGLNEPDPFPAAIEAVSGRDFLAANADQAGVTTRITMRRWDGVIAVGMRARDVTTDAVYDIKAVLPDPTLRHHVRLMCETGVNNG